MLYCRWLALALITLACGEVLWAAEFTPGNILVTHNEILYEFTPDGTQVQSVPIVGNLERARDLAYDETGVVHIFNGTRNPLLSTFDPTSPSWAQHGFPGWSIMNNVSFGGAAVFEQFVFVVDMETSSPGEPNGLVRFDTNAGYAGVRFAIGADYIDCTVGFDGKLYALRSNSISVDVFEPLTLAPLGGTTLEAEVRAVAVNVAGVIFGAAWVDDRIYRFNSDGTAVQSILAGTNDLTDIDLDGAGRIVVGSRSDMVVVTTEALASTSLFRVVSTFDPTFVEWVEDPVPVRLQSFFVE